MSDNVADWATVLQRAFSPPPPHPGIPVHAPCASSAQTVPAATGHTPPQHPVLGKLAAGHCPAVMCVCERDPKGPALPSSPSLARD
jgi:hypothetical protein